jgi:hypothetical protein
MLFQAIVNILPYLIPFALFFWFWTIADCVTHELPSEKRIIWLMIIIFMNFIGALLYYLVRRPERLRETKY